MLYIKNIITIMLSNEKVFLFMRKLYFNFFENAYSFYAILND